MTTNTNAATIRKTFAALLESARVADDLTAEVVYDYEKGDLGQRRVVVEVTSRGSNRPRLTLQGRRTTTFMDVLILVAYWDDDGWSEDDAEDRLDLLEAEVIDVVDTNTSKTGSWRHMDLANRSTTEFVIIGGLEFKRMTIPLQVEV